MSSRLAGHGAMAAEVDGGGGWLGGVGVVSTNWCGDPWRDEQRDKCLWRRDGSKMMVVVKSWAFGAHKLGRLIHDGLSTIN